MATESIGIRPWPTWVRGDAYIDGDEIVLDAREAQAYNFLEPVHFKTLLPDLAALHDFQRQDPQAFAKDHGLLWHGPEDFRVYGSCRESLHKWQRVGEYLTMTITLYMALKQGLDDNTAKPVRDMLWLNRDARLFIGTMPDDKDKLLEYASIQLAELITRGLEGSRETLVASCSILRDGEKVGDAGDFRYVLETPDLVATAYKHLASLIVARVEYRKCKGCGRWFLPSHGSQIYHTKDCGRNKRRRDSYWNTKETKKA